MKCKKVKLLLAPYMLGDFADNLVLLDQLKTHLQRCNSCTEEYQSIKQTIVFIERHRDIFAEAFAEISLERTKKKDVPKHLWKKISVNPPKTPTNLRYFLQRVSAVAACLIMGLSIWITFRYYSKPHSLFPSSSCRQVSVAPGSSIRIELISKNGIIPIPANQQITSNHEVKTLIINGKHRMMMNADTILAVKPLTTNNLLGCKIQLNSGQIYTHVEHDGNPFVVDTPHGQAVITGTTFDIKTTKTDTTLVVIEGTVQFKSGSDDVKVTAGQMSKAVGQSAPLRPMACNVSELAAWTSGNTTPAIPIQAESMTDLSGLSWPWPIKIESINLKEMDYDLWVKEKQYRFKHQFPQIFKFKDALAKEGIESNYPQLLVRSGDLWQFVHTKKTPYRFSSVDINSLIMLAADYGFDEQWLWRHLPIAVYASENQTSIRASLAVLNTFEQWHRCIVNIQKSPEDELGFDIQNLLFHATMYLADTRTLVWFAVREGTYDLTERQRLDVLILLQEQVNAAITCQDNILFQPLKNRLACDLDQRKKDKWWQWADVIHKSISTIIITEKKITEHEID